jgi:hypothetical protein
MMGSSVAGLVVERAHRAIRCSIAPPENFLSDAELRDIAAPVLMIWGGRGP